MLSPLFSQCTRWWASHSSGNTFLFSVIFVSAIPQSTNRQMRPWTQSRLKASAPLFSTMAARITRSQSFVQRCKSLPSHHGEFFGTPAETGRPFIKTTAHQTAWMNSDAGLRGEEFFKSLKLCIYLSCRRSWLSKNSRQWQRRFYAAVFMLSFQARCVEEREKSGESRICYTCHLYLLYAMLLLLVLTIYYLHTVKPFLSYHPIFRLSKELSYFLRAWMELWK